MSIAFSQLISTPTTRPVATGVSGEAAKHLVSRLNSRAQEFYTAVSTIDFYAEFSLVAVALVAAWVISKLIRQKLVRAIERSVIRIIDKETLVRALILLDPILMLAMLGVGESIMDFLEYDHHLSEAVFRLGYAYFWVRCVLLVVRSRPIAYFVSMIIVIDSALTALRIQHPITAYLDSIAFDVGKYHISILHLVQGFAIFVMVFWAAGVCSRTLESYLRRTTSLSYNARELMVKFFRIFVYLVAALITLSATGIDLTAFAVFGGALGVGVGLGLQKLTANFLSGITMLMEKSIKIGDMIEVGSHTGWVRQLNIRYALIETFDGREIMIPNEELISNRVVNWTLSNTLARVDVVVTISADSDPQKAQRLILDAASENPLALKNPIPYCWLQDISGNGYKFLLVFWIADVKEGKNGPQSDVLFAILKKFSESDIALAKPVALLP